MILEAHIAPEEGEAVTIEELDVILILREGKLEVFVCPVVLVEPEEQVGQSQQGILVVTVLKEGLFVRFDGLRVLVKFFKYIPYLIMSLYCIFGEPRCLLECLKRFFKHIHVHLRLCQKHDGLQILRIIDNDLLSTSHCIAKVLKLIKVCIGKMQKGFAKQLLRLFFL